MGESKNNRDLVLQSTASNTFQYSIGVRGYTKENIHIQINQGPDGPSVKIECHQTMESNQATETNTGGGNKQSFKSSNIETKTTTKTQFLPQGTDMKTVQTNLDVGKGEVLITGRYTMTQPGEKTKALLQNEHGKPIAPANPDPDLTFNKDEFKLAIHVKGFREENVQIQMEGRKVTIDCRQEEKTVNSVKGFHEATRVFHYSTTLPDGTDLKSVKTQVDSNAGLVLITGRVQQ